MTRFELGQLVWFVDTWSRIIKKGRIIQIDVEGDGIFTEIFYGIQINGEPIPIHPPFVSDYFVTQEKFVFDNIGKAKRYLKKFCKQQK